MEYGEQEDEEMEEDDDDDDDEVEEEEGEECETEEDEENGGCAKENDKPWNQMRYKCKHAVENSSRFSLRVMEAMRFLQSHENVLPISSVEDIVDYIAKNYNNDGDLYAQVRTALKQLCTHGFVVEALKDEYQLIGPFGSSATVETCNCEVERNNSEIYFSTPKHTQLRRKFTKKCKKKPRCHCEKLRDEPKFGIRRKESIFKDKDIALSRMDGDKSRERTPKRIRRTNNDVAEASRNIEQYERGSLTSNVRINENSRDNIFQGIRNFFPRRSQTREKELKKWIQRCRHECERQKKNN